MVNPEGFDQVALLKRLFCFYTTSVLHTIVRLQPEGVEEKGYTVCRKTRGQFPNNPWGWSYQQAWGRWRSHPMLMPFWAVKPSLSTSVLGVGGSLGEI